MPDFKVASGRSNPELAQKVADHLGVRLSKTKIRNFELKKSSFERWL